MTTKPRSADRNNLVSIVYTEYLIEIIRHFEREQRVKTWSLSRSKWPNSNRRGWTFWHD